jgi:hypothetical protein
LVRFTATKKAARRCAAFKETRGETHGQGTAFWQTQPHAFTPALVDYTNDEFNDDVPDVC